MKLILASASPRRRELLRVITPDFEVVPPGICERASSQDVPFDVVTEYARHKAEAVAGRKRGLRGLIIGVDTVVCLDDQALGKPEDRAQAARMLERLSGRAHTVISGLWLINTVTGQTRSDSVTTQVRFRRLSPEEIERYLDSGEYRDKAGAYAIQGRAALFVERIEGDFYNVMGLPLARLYQLMQELGWSPP